VTREVIDPAPQEFPRYDERLTGKPYRYAYAVACRSNQMTALSAQPACTSMILVRTNATFTISARAGCRRSSSSCQRMTGRAEDEGWLIGYVSNVESGTSDFVILNAADFTAPPVAEVHIPYRIPPGFHGNFVPRGVRMTPGSVGGQPTLMASSRLIWARGRPLSS
jgi:carotenoid cleavage dioxygenase-like enzyme